MKRCYDIDFFKKLKTILVLVNIASLVVGMSVRATELDSLRVLINSLQNTIEQKQRVMAGLSKEFNKVNRKVYKYKAKKRQGMNPLSRLQMQNALRISHQLADSIDTTSQYLRKQKLRLQQVYKTAIRQIQIAIEQEMSSVKLNGPDKNRSKSQLNRIRELENEMTVYSSRLQKMQIDEKGWEKIRIEPGDSIRRLKLKLALLEDFLKNLENYSISLNTDNQKIQSERKTYQELLDFYTELEESLDDDQDIFDHNRLDELQEKIDNLDGESAKLKKQMAVLQQDIGYIKVKIGRFRNTMTSNNKK